MPLMLDDMRAEFARHLASQPSARFSMDKALVHVLALAYAAGIQDSKARNAEMEQELICPSCSGSGHSGYYLQETGEPIICKPCLGTGISERPDAAEAIQLARDLLDPEAFGHATTHEVRQAARRALGKMA